MATLIDAERVKYLCSCKRLKPLCYLYYCKYCKPLTLKCKDCVHHEIDQKYFCANCFDNKVLKEVMNLKYKCANCFSCPSCKNLLMIRASSAKSKDPNQAQSSPNFPNQQNPETSPSTTTQSQKVFYLMCGFCRWTTRDVGIPDVTTAPGGWKLQDNPNLKRINELLDAYKEVATREKLEKDRKKYPALKRRTFHHPSSTSIQISSSTSQSTLHSDKYGILAPVNKRLASNSSNTDQTLEQQQISIEQHFNSLIQPSKTVDSFEEISQDLFTKEININYFTTINQRHANPEFQPSKSSELYPLNKHYQSKESKRCTGCEHNVLKPESNITSIKFKLHQMAIFLVPEVRIVTIPLWVQNEPNEVILSITNRYEGDVTLQFLNIEKDPKSENLSGFQSNSTISFDSIDENTNITVDRQDGSKVLVAALKQSDLETQGFVCYRRDNKIAIKCKITPLSSEMNHKNVKCILGLKCSINIPENTQSPSTSHSSSNTTNNITLIHRVFLDFGPLKVEDGLKIIPRPRYIDDCLKASLK